MTQFEQTRALLASQRPRPYHAIATDLGLPRAAAGTICDIINGRHEHVSHNKHQDIRRRLGLPYTITVQAVACPSCGVVHGDGLDCHNQPGEVAIVPAGARIIPPAKRKRPPYKRPTWAMVRALEARIAELEEQL